MDITRGKGLQLKEEEVTYGVYKKKCGFRISRPFIWAAALEDLLIDYRWDYTVQEDKYTQCLIKLTNLEQNALADVQSESQARWP